MSQKNPTVMESLEAMKPRQINQIIQAANGGLLIEECKAAQTEFGEVLYKYFVSELETHPGVYIPPMELDEDEIEELSAIMFGNTDD